MAHVKSGSSRPKWPYAAVLMKRWPPRNRSRLREMTPAALVWTAYQTYKAPCARPHVQTYPSEPDSGCNKAGCAAAECSIEAPCK